MSYPRLSTTDAADLLMKLCDADHRDLTELGGAYRGRATTYATAVHLADEQHLDDLREAVVKLAMQSGFPDQKPTGRFDSGMPALLGEHLRISPAEAGGVEVWNYLTLVLLPDVALWRWPNPSRNPGYERLIGKPRNVFRRHWWRGHLLGGELAALLGEDELVQVVERPATLGGDPRVARAVALAFLNVCEGHRLMTGGSSLRSLPRMDLMRLVAKRVLRMGRVVVLSTLSDDELDDLASELVLATATLLADQLGATMQPSDSTFTKRFSRERVSPPTRVDTVRSRVASKGNATSERERTLNQELVRLYERAEDEVGVNGASLRRLLADYGGLGAARHVLADDHHEWFRELSHHGRLDLTVETVALKPGLSALFTPQELQSAQRRLVAGRPTLQRAKVAASHGNGDAKSLKRQFHRAMVDAYERCRSEVGYNPIAFIRMISEMGAVDTAVRLVHAPKPSDGFAELWMNNRLDLTAEALVTLPEFEELFDEETLRLATQRLVDHAWA